jgi:tetratricopeptide (TPR) repeat protein
METGPETGRSDSERETEDGSGPQVLETMADLGVEPSSSSGDLKLERGTTVGRYVLLDRVGAGGMGVVYAAYDPELDRKVALKLLHERKGARASKGHARLLREAQAMARLSHPNVIAVHDVGAIGGTVFIAMEYVAGQTLAEWQKTRPPWKEVLDVYGRAGAGLAAAHAVGMVHRDFKPENVLIGADGRVRVLDFGLARREVRAEKPQAEKPTGNEDKVPSAAEQAKAREGGDVEQTVIDTDVVGDLTRTGAVLGTPAYMSPEQHLGDPADARSDQFSFCVAFYEAMYGRRPFAGDSHATLAFQVTQGNITEAPRDSDVPTWLRKVLVRGLKLEPDQRYADMGELLADLSRDRGGQRRGMIGLLAAAALVAGGAIGYAQLAGGDELCSGAEDKLAGVWDDERKNAIEAAFRATKLPFADDAWNSTETMLDEYARTFVDGHTDACMATQVRGEQSEEMLDRRMQCLEDRRRELAALVDQLAVATPATIERSTSAANDLTGPGVCSDTEALRARVPLPVNPDVREAVEILRGDLAKSAALRTSGEFQAALDLAKQTLAAAQETGYRPLEAQAWLSVAGAQRELYEMKAAITSFENAVIAAEAGGDMQSAARGWNAQIELYGDWELELDRAETAARHTEALLAQLGNVPELEADYYQNLATVDANRDRYQQALDGCARALEIVQRTRGPGSIAEASVVNTLGNVYYDLADYDNALISFERSLEIAQRVYGDEHPEVAAEINNIGMVLDDLGRYPQARDHYQRALDITVAAYGEDNPDAAAFNNNLGSSHHGQENWKEARGFYETALSGYEAAFGERHPDVAMVLTNLTLVDEQEGKLEDALKKNTLALSIYEERYGQMHRNYATTLHQRAGVLSALDRNEEALVLHERALSTHKQVLGPDHLYISDSLQYYGDALGQAQRWEDALHNYRRGLQLREGNMPEEHQELAVARGSVGMALVELGRPDEGTELLERGIRTLEDQSADAHAVAEFRLRLGVGYWDTGRDRRLARELVELARDHFREEGRIGQHDLDASEAWLRKHR